MRSNPKKRLLQRSSYKGKQLLVRSVSNFHATLPVNHTSDKRAPQDDYHSMRHTFLSLVYFELV